MVTFIANQIIKARKKSLEDGQNKYRAYFVRTHIYAAWQPDVDAILIQDGYADCIVVE